MRFLTTLCLFLVFYDSSGQVQRTFALQLADSLAIHAEKLPQESVYIQTSKEVFEKGEDLWFSATILERQTLLPSTNSGTLYVELRSDLEDKPLLREMYSIENGFANGHLFLSDTLEAGNYSLVGFTNLSKGENQPFKSLRKLSIKDRIIPHVFIKSYFSQDSFAEGEKISGRLELTSSDGIEIADLKTIVEFRFQGETLDRFRGRSDENGLLSFESKKTDFPTGTTLLIRVGHEDHEETHVTPIPLEMSKKISLSFMPEGGNIIAGISNYVAFKAVTDDGKPANVKKAILMSDGVEITTLETEHAGMGRFRFFADQKKTYQVKLIDPPQAKTFSLPEFQDEGVQMHLRQRDSEKLVFSVLKTKGINTDSVHLAVKRRGMVEWVASALLDEDGLLLNVPIDELPAGIVEISLYSSSGTILSERLVYLHPQRQLQVAVESNQERYGTKDSVNLKLKVTDEEGNPIQSKFSLSVVDEIYASPFAKKTIASHFLLTDELKGSLFEPDYYFNSENPKAPQHLDLLMLTQGWRSYEWSFGHLVDLEEMNASLHGGSIQGQIDLKSLTGQAKRKDTLQVQLFGKFGVMMVNTDSLGRFQIPAEALIASKGSVIGVKVLDSPTAQIGFSSSFDEDSEQRSIRNLVYDHQRTIRRSKNWDEGVGANDDVVELDEVTVTANKVTYDTFWGKPLGIHQASSFDYVCQYNILNCGNHRHGTKPVEGRVYLNGRGLLVRYDGPDDDEDRKIKFVKGHYQIPIFYQPNYQQNPDERLIPDFRNTLIWEPNLVTDENGEAEISFYTSDIRSLFNVYIEGLGVNGQFGVHSFDLQVYN